jgi:hypothetical protein
VSSQEDFASLWAEIESADEQLKQDLGDLPPEWETMVSAWSSEGTSPPKAVSANALCNYLMTRSRLRTELSALNAASLNDPVGIPNDHKHDPLPPFSSWSSPFSTNFVTWTRADAISSVNLERLLIVGTLDIRNASFGALRFKDCVFSGHIFLRSCEFHVELALEDCKLLGPFDLDEYDLKSPPRFARGTLTVERLKVGNLDLKGLVADQAWLHHTNGADTMNLSGSDILELYARKLKFGGSLWASDAFFLEALLRSSTFEQGVYFAKSRICIGDFSFVNFGESASFDCCVFEEPPWFHGAELPSNISFKGAKFHLERPTKWSKPNHISAGVAFRTLKAQMNKLRAFDEEQRFFELEQRAQRKSTPFLEAPVVRTLSLLYDLVSRYGSSPGRALLFFVAWNSAFALVLGSVADYSTQCAAAGQPFGSTILCKYVSDETLVSRPSMATAAAFVQATHNAINPIAAFSTSTSVRPDGPVLTSLSVIQSIGSFAVLALLLLAIRARFLRGVSGSS